MASEFVPASSFNFADAYDSFIKRRRAQGFLTGNTAAGLQQDTAALEASLQAGLRANTERERFARQTELEERGLDLQEANLESLSGFREGELALQHDRIKEAERGRRLGLYGGMGKTFGLAAFMPLGKTITTTAGGVTTTMTPTAWSKTIELFKKIWSRPSSIRYKENVSDMGNITSKRIYDLSPVSFKYKEDKAKSVQYGLIAEEVAKVIPEMVIFDEQGRPEMIDYSKLIVLLLSELQEIKKTL